MNIENRIYQLAIEIFGFDFQQYKDATGRILLGVCINAQQSRFEHLFGDFPKNFLPTINTQFHNTIAGYRVAVGAHFRELKFEADVFLLNKNNLNDNDKEIHSLLMHEICHMIIDSNSLNEINSTFSEKDKYHGGRKLYKRTDIENKRITKHSVQFCNLLSAASEIAAQKYPNEFTDRWDCINNAMRYDLKGSLRV